MLRASTADTLNDRYAALFGVDADALWNSATARPHTSFDGDVGYYVAWRRNGVHVSRPHSDDFLTSDRLSVEAVEDLQNLDYWQRFAAVRDLQVVGLSTHSYLDTDPDPDSVVETIDSAALEELQALVPQEEWNESGWSDDPPHLVGLYRDDALAAASNLNRFAGRPHARTRCARLARTRAVCGCRSRCCLTRDS